MTFSTTAGTGVVHAAVLVQALQQPLLCCMILYVDQWYYDTTAVLLFRGQQDREERIDEMRTISMFYFLSFFFTPIMRGAAQVGRNFNFRKRVGRRG